MCGEAVTFFRKGRFLRESALSSFNKEKAPTLLLTAPGHNQHWSADVNNPTPDEAGWYLDEFDAERFWAHVNRRGGTRYATDPLSTATGECWIWNSDLGNENYGRFRLFGNWQMAHRVAFKDLGKSLPDELSLDHLYRVHACVNPAHLDAVTHAVNISRGARAKRTHCVHGHEYTEENTVHQSRNGKAHRYCRTCLTASKRATYLRRKNAA